MTHNVAHLKTIEKPNITLESAPKPLVESAEAPEEIEPWPASFDDTLSSFMQKETIEKLKELFLSGPDPVIDETTASSLVPDQATAEGSSTALPTSFSSAREKRKFNGKERDGRGRNAKKRVEDNRQVVSDVSHEFVHLRSHHSIKEK